MIVINPGRPEKRGRAVVSFIVAPDISITVLSAPIGLSFRFSADRMRPEASPQLRLCFAYRCVHSRA